MTASSATETPMRLEPVTRDPFIDDLEPHIPLLPLRVVREVGLPQAHRFGGTIQPPAWRPRAYAHGERQAA